MQAWLCASLLGLAGCSAGLDLAAFPYCAPEMLAVTENTFREATLGSARDSLVRLGVLSLDSPVRVARATVEPRLENRREMAGNLAQQYQADAGPVRQARSAVFGLYVDQEGIVRQVRPIASSGSFAFDRAGADALGTARFSAALIENCRASAWIELPLEVTGRP